MVDVGLIKMFAVLGIGDFCYIMKWNEYNSLLCCNVMIEDVGGVGFYLFYVDAGYYVVGMK